VPLGKRWTAAYRLTVQDGAVVVGEVRIFPQEPPGRALPGQWSAEVLGIRARVPWGGITGRLVRVKVTEHLRVADQVLRQSDDWLRHPLALDAARRRAQPGLGRPRKPDLWYARAAGRYAAALRGGSTRPVVDVAAQLGLTVARARDAIHQARARGLLTPGTRGRRGGALTRKALGLLDTVRARRRTATRTRRAGRPPRKERRSDG
jgi:hypothetical protein